MCILSVSKTFPSKGQCNYSSYPASVTEYETGELA
jgi:hypothetical protein